MSFSPWAGGCALSQDKSTETHFIIETAANRPMIRSYRFVAADVVLPGIFIALLIRFDDQRKPGSRFYFYSVLVAYLLGLVATYIAMQVSDLFSLSNSRAKPDS
eukprot:COSAG05_NODE_137_length_16843_cov_121.090779_2_plen_104_part_00